MPKDIVTLKAHLLQSCKDFCIANRLDPKQWTYNEYTGEDIMDDESGPLMFTASKWDPQEPVAYIADISIGSNRLIMPKGILVFLGYQAGYIDWIDCTLPLDGVSFTEAMRLCGKIAAMFEHIGFKDKNRNDRLTEQEFHDRGGLRDQYGQWLHDDPLPMVLTLEIKNVNRLPITSFTTVVGRPTPPDVAPTYLIDVIYRLTSDGPGDDLFALKKARRFALTGNEQKGIPLKVWFDDPDWRPKGWQGTWLK